jgi:hypothetical protein
MEEIEMWRDDPVARKQVIAGRQAELRAEADSERVARQAVEDGRDYLVSGLKIQFGDLFIVVGRRLCDDGGTLRRARARAAH